MNLVYIQATSTTEMGSPWIYPASITDPTTSQNYTIPLTLGDNNVSLIIWNNSPNWDFIQGKFIIAIKSGLAQVTIKNITVSKDQEDLTGKSTPDNFSIPNIFPCPWMQYNIPGYLADARSLNGYQGAYDISGTKVEVHVVVTGNPSNVDLYFLAWGYRLAESSLTYTGSPASHITEASGSALALPEFNPVILLSLLSGVLILFPHRKASKKSF